MTNQRCRLGREVRRIRDERMLKQGEAAKALGFSQGFLSDIEGGKTAPTIRFITSFCAYFELEGTAKETLLHALGARGAGWKVYPEHHEDQL